MWCGARGVPLGEAAGSYVRGYTHGCGQASRSFGGGSWTVHLAAFDLCVWLLPPSCRALHSVSGPSLAPPRAAGPYMIARGFLGLPAGAVAHAFTRHLTLTLIYILVVGQFGLATGSGGITQSNVHTTSRVHQINNVHAPLPKSWSTQTRLEPYPSSSAQ